MSLSKVLLFCCMAIGAAIFIDNFVFAATTGMKYIDAPSYNKAYVDHFPKLLRPLLVGEGILFRFFGGFLLLFPGIAFIINYLKTDKQSSLTWGLIGICLGVMLIWMNM